MSNRLDFFTPVAGRFISGSLTEKRSKDSDNRPIEPEKQRYEFGIAFQKNEIWSMLTEQFRPWLTTQLASDANGLSRMQEWFSTLTGFSMKISDGDKPNAKGQLNENSKGCFVMWFSSSFSPDTVDSTMTNQIPADSIKRGYYVQIAGNISPNGLTASQAGIYLNATHVRLVAEGEEIKGGVDAVTAFGGTAAPTSLPPGAMPLGSNTGAASAFPTGVPAGMPGTQPANHAPAPTASPGEPNVQPHTGILTGPPPLPQ